MIIVMSVNGKDMLKILSSNGDVGMIYNLILELNSELGLALYVADKQPIWTGNEITELVSEDVKGLTSKDIATVMRLCKKYGIVLVRWIFKLNIEEKEYDLCSGHHRKVDMLSLHVRPMLKWEQEWRI